MKHAGLGNILRRLRWTISNSAGGLTDADLLGRWVAYRDEAAFESLVWRHAATVLGVCKRILGDVHAAEDAAQAAFLALTMKAASIGRRQAVAAWLYTVAYRAALQARNRQGRTVLCEAHQFDTLPARDAEDPAWRDLRPVLDEEISRLPEKYRAVFVLCHVQGRTNAEAARELRCPAGTVLSRLARARQRLQDRLTRRGVTLGAGAITLAMVGEASAAPAVSKLVSTVLGAAAGTASGQGLGCVVSAEAAAITEGVLRTMLMTKAQFGTAVVVAVALLAGGGGVLTYRTVAQEPGLSKNLKPIAQVQRAPSAEEENLRDLLKRKEQEIRELKDRLAAVQAEYRERMAQLEVKMARKEELAKRAVDATFDAIQQQTLGGEQRLAAEKEALRRAAAEAREQAKSAQAATQRPFQGDETLLDRARRIADLEQAKDDVELREAQVALKRAELRAAEISRNAAQEAVQATGGTDNKLRIDLATHTGQIGVKQAEVREAEVRLALARRRVARLQGASDSTSQPPHGSGAVDIREKLDELTKELKALRMHLEVQAQRKP
jgi:RNA polymerase sigma factor (sigma-70 family)